MASFNRALPPGPQRLLLHRLPRRRPEPPGSRARPARRERGWSAPLLPHAWLRRARRGPPRAQPRITRREASASCSRGRGMDGDAPSCRALAGWAKRRVLGPGCSRAGGGRRAGWGARAFGCCSWEPWDWHVAPPRPREACPVPSLPPPSWSPCRLFFRHTSAARICVVWWERAC